MKGCFLDIPIHPPGAFQTRGGRRLTRLYGGGGGGDSGHYESLEALYAEQAASARLLRAQAEKYLPGMVDRYAESVNSVLNGNYVEKQAEQAGADMAEANVMERAASERQLSSMGINPADRRYATAMAGQETANAARMAAGKNTARNEAQQLQRAVAQDAVGTFTGQSNSAANQLASASNGLMGVYNQQAQMNQARQAQMGNNVANVIGGSMAVGQATGFFNQGGSVKKGKNSLLNVPRGCKCLERHMLGGAAGAQQNRGFFNQAQVMPPVSAPQPPEPGVGDVISGGIQAYNTVNNMYKMGTNLAGKLQGGNVGAGIEAGTEATTALSTAAESTATEAVGAAATEAAGAAATEAAGAVATEAVGAVATEAVGSAAGAAMGAIGTALPWIGAAFAVGSLLDLWNEGGAIRVQEAVEAMTPAQRQAAAQAYAAAAAREKDPIVAGHYAQLAAQLEGQRRQGKRNATGDYRAGRPVSGPGGHTDDLVPALLSDGEHVMNAEAAALIGHDQLQHLNHQGLKLREQGVTPAAIRRRFHAAYRDLDKRKKSV